MQGKKVTIEEYDPNWALEFEKLKSVFQKHLDSLIMDIQHVGSTAVVGMPAKPVLDIDIIIENETFLQPVIEKLTALGYHHRGDLGIKGREAFKRLNDQTPNDGLERIWQTHHIYVCPKDNLALKNHIQFRDFLKTNPQIAIEYGVLKKELAKKYDSVLYTEKKTDFILSILEKMGFDMDNLENIRTQNKAS
jgi:GrpB-like predicted nucleotidyltransferase (UPF0157 family)